MENHIHIHHIIALRLRERNAAQSFCDLNKFFGEETISKNQVER